MTDIRTDMWFDDEPEIDALTSEEIITEELYRGSRALRRRIRALRSIDSLDHFLQDPE